MKLAQARVHFIGVGGIGMCGLAELLHNMGTRVSGSDLAENAHTQRLRAMGIEVHIGQKPENVQSAEVAVYSSAVKSDNPEFREARQRKIPLIPRAEALAEIMRLKRGIAIGGSHGKTTTTSMTASIFLEAKAEPTIVVGGRLDLIKSTALLGQGEWMVAEADESDGSFLRLSPEMAVVTNIDNDHLDHYGTVENLKKAFHDFASRIPFYGLAIVCGDDPIVRDVFQDFPKRVLFYGFGENNDLRLRGEKSEYQVFLGNVRLGAFRLQVPGKHNALNAAAALAAGLEAGLSFDVCAKGLQAFGGVDRRFQFKGQAGGVDIYDDYGHHPTEIQAVLAAFREKFPGRRIVTVFQPHRYSRTLLCWDQFRDCFKEADRVLICDIYAAGEMPIKEITSERMVSEVRHTSARHLPNTLDRVAEIRRELKSGDVFVTLGAGDVWKLGMSVLEEGGPG
ncbi:MAG: UDP-N-acetylmuramate--L-alanine ligase [Bdellovibrionaceae bacterium]|nr:UDP-N-acetylmuramate--L-alanine ligase [Pseudobdellovibrionaceae bacterium]